MKRDLNSATYVMSCIYCNYIAICFALIFHVMVLAQDEATDLVDTNIVTKYLKRNACLMNKENHVSFSLTRAEGSRGAYSVGKT